MVLGVQGLIAGQWTDDILPSAEKFYLGGNRLGRGFYAGEVTGDKAIGIAAEVTLDVRPGSFSLARLGMPTVQLQPTAQFYLFRDYGRTWENLPTDPDRRLESWGGGVRMMLLENLQVDVEGVHRLTRRVDAGGAAAKPLPESAVFFRVLARF